MPMTNFLKDKLRRHMFGTATYNKPTQLWFALYTTAPTLADAGVEIAAPSYVRIRRDPGDANWNFPADTGEANNVADIQYAAPLQSWGVAVAQGVIDEAGNLLGWENLLNPKSINAGDTAPKFPATSWKAIFG